MQCLTGTTIEYRERPWRKAIDMNMKFKVLSVRFGGQLFKQEMVVSFQDRYTQGGSLAKIKSLLGVLRVNALDALMQACRDEAFKQGISWELTNSNRSIHGWWLPPLEPAQYAVRIPIPKGKEDLARRIFEEQRNDFAKHYCTIPITEEEIARKLPQWYYAAKAANDRAIGAMQAELTRSMYAPTPMWDKLMKRPEPRWKRKKILLILK
jgi:hypothetical protein